MGYVPLSLNSYRINLIGGVRITIRFVNVIGGRPRVSRSWKIGQWKCLRTGNWVYFLEQRGRKWQEDGEKYMKRCFIFVLFAKYYLFSKSYNLPWRFRGECRYSSTLSLTSTIDGVGGQRYAPAASPPGKHPVPIVHKTKWTPRPFWTARETSPHRGSSPEPSSPWQVAILTTLLWPTTNNTRANKLEVWWARYVARLRTWKRYANFWRKNQEESNQLEACDYMTR